MYVISANINLPSRYNGNQIDALTSKINKLVFETVNEFLMTNELEANETVDVDVWCDEYDDDDD